MMSELATFAVVIVSFSSQRANIRLKMSKIEKIEPSADCGPSDQAAILRPLAGPYKTMPKNQTSSRGIFSPHIGIRGFGYARPYRCTTIVNAKSAAPATVRMIEIARFSAPLSDWVDVAFAAAAQESLTPVETLAILGCAARAV